METVAPEIEDDDASFAGAPFTETEQEAHLGEDITAASEAGGDGGAAEAQIDGLNLWIGSANVSASLHYDLEHNMHVQISGSKEWTILPPKLLPTTRYRLFNIGSSNSPLMANFQPLMSKLPFTNVLCLF